MYLSLYVVIFASSLMGKLVAEPPSSISLTGLYEVTIELSHSRCPVGAVFPEAAFVTTCICIDGLWAIYKGLCQKPDLVIGSTGGCYTFSPHEVSKLHPLQAKEGAENSLAVFNHDMTKLKNVISIEEKHTKEIESILLVKGDIMIGNYQKPTQNTIICQLTMIPGVSEICEKEELSPYFCVYESARDEYLTKPGINDFINTHVPLECYMYLNDDKRHCELSEGSSNFTRKRRDATDWFNKKKQSRIFAPTAFLSEHEFIERSTLDELDEDITVENRTSDPLNLHMRSHVWNFYFVEANQMMGLSKQKSPVSSSQALKFLQLCKNIIKKGCYELKMKKFWFDLSVYVFSRITSSFSYEEHVTYVSFSAVDRITRALEVCYRNIIIEDFSRFEDNPQWLKTVKASLEEQFKKSEPLLFTAWIIFAYSYNRCYGFFRSLNDHHLFASIMHPLFDKHKNKPEWRHDQIDGLLGNTNENVYDVLQCFTKPFNEKLKFIKEIKNSQYPTDTQLNVASEMPEEMESNIGYQRELSRKRREISSYVLRHREDKGTRGSGAGAGKKHQDHSQSGFFFNEKSSRLKQNAHGSFVHGLSYGMRHSMIYTNFIRYHCLKDLNEVQYIC